MAKKKSTRRPNLSQETLERARAERRSESLETAPAAAGAASGPASSPKIKRAGTPISAATRIPSAEELRREYSHVMKDLRNLLILAAVLMVAIVVVALALPRPTG